MNLVLFYAVREVSVGLKVLRVSSSSVFEQPKAWVRSKRYPSRIYIFTSAVSPVWDVYLSASYCSVDKAINHPT